jgi:hypothetical protein
MAITGSRFSFGIMTAAVPVIDPTLAYSTYLGGSGDDFGFDVAVDASGYACVTGYTNSTDFPTTPEPFQTLLPRVPWELQTT